MPENQLSRTRVYEKGGALSKSGFVSNHNLANNLKVPCPKGRGDIGGGPKSLFSLIFQSFSLHIKNKLYFCNVKSSVTNYMGSSLLLGLQVIVVNS